MSIALNHNLCACLFFIVFIVFGSFAMISILTGVISESMVSRGQLSRENMRFEEEQRLASFREKLRSHFKEYDASGDGLLSREEFRDSVPAILELVEKEHLGVQHTPEELMLVYDLMDTDDSGEIDINEFLTGMEQFETQMHQVPLQIMKFQALMVKRHNVMQKDVEALHADIDLLIKAVDARGVSL